MAVSVTAQAICGSATDQLLRRPLSERQLVVALVVEERRLDPVREPEVGERCYVRHAVPVREAVRIDRPPARMLGGLLPIDA